MLVYVDKGKIAVNKPGMRLDAAAAGALYVMAAAAAREGIMLLLVSAHRSYEYQRALYERALAGALPGERIQVAPPGESEHETGRAVDITSVEHPALETSFAQTAAGRWLAENAGKYGFRMSYPDEYAEYGYEPWHFLYSPHIAGE